MIAGKDSLATKDFKDVHCGSSFTIIFRVAFPQYHIDLENAKGYLWYRILNHSLIRF